MAEYIDREAAIEICEKEYRERLRMADYCGDTVAWNIGAEIKNMPAADVAPVRHGRWERIGIKGRKELPIYPCCSACGIVSAAFRSEWEGLRGAWKYCPNCGAKMDKKED